MAILLKRTYISKIMKTNENGFKYTNDENHENHENPENSCL